MVQVLSTSKCPDAETLATYVSGNLDETKAESLSDHLHRCSNCQQQIDRLGGTDDSLIKALRYRLNSEVAPTDDSLNRLIANAAKLLSGETAPRSSSETVALDTFVTCLRKSGLVNSSEVDLLVEQSSSSDSRSFARELISRGKITTFQAKALIRGKWKGLVLGNYIILEKLGQGGMGNVFKARHRRMGRTVCLKVLHSSGRKSPEQLERFRREARAVAALDHPNIVVAHDADEEGGIPYLVMQFIEGNDLSDRVEEQGPMQAEQAVSVALQAATALQYAHEKGVIHRDIKPHNVILDQSGSVKILDMGLARFDSYLSGSLDGITQASMTASGAIMGTVDYMSPEQALNCRNADRRSDIYSLGCTLYFLLNGVPMFDGETIMEKLIAHREQDAPTLAGIDEQGWVDAVFQRMVAKDPDQRYDSMAEVASELEAIRAGEAPKAAAAFMPPPSSDTVDVLSDVTLDTVTPMAAPRVRTSPERKAVFTRPVVWASLIGLAIVAGVGYATWMLLPDREEATVAENSAATKLREPAQTPLPFPNAHPDTLANNGPGRIMLVVPHAWFYEEHYTAVRDALAGRNVSTVVASSSKGPANPKHNKIKPISLDEPLDDFDVQNFDGVIFLGGNVGEFKDKGPAAKTAGRIVQTALEKQRVVVGMGNGWEVLEQAMDLGSCACDYKKIHGLDVGIPKELCGRVVRVNETKHASDLINLMLDELLAKDLRPASG